jgi:prepilin-type processing-associated H-X9-DG protein
MRPRFFTARFRLAGLAAVLGWAAVAGASDLARFMPGETAMYLGWSQCAKPGSAELQWQQELSAAMSDMLAGQGRREDPATVIVRWAGDVLPILQTGSVGIGVFDVTIGDRGFDVQAAALVESPDADRMDTLMRRLMELLDLADELEPTTVGDVAMQAVPIPETPLRLLWGVHNKVFILALGDAAADKVVAALTGGGPKLADADELKFARRKVAAQLDGQHLCFYVDVQRVVTRGKAIAQELLGELPPMVDPVLTELGVTSVRSKYVHFERVDNRSRLVGFAHTDGPPRGLMKLFDQKPLTDDDLKIIPKDAYWASVYNLDLAGVWTEVLRIIDALAPDQRPAVDGALAMTTPILGFSIVDELLPAFGDTWAVFDAPDHGGLLLTGTVLTAEAKDPAALQRILERLVQVVTPLAAQGDVKLALKKLTRGEHEIHYVLIGGVPCPVAPAWGFADGRWVLALYPQTVATALKQVDPKTRGPSLLDRPEVQAAKAGWPKTVQGVDYFDTHYFTRMFYPLVNGLRTLGVSQLAAHGVELDLVTMPPLPESTQDVTNFVGALGRDSDGVLYIGAGDAMPLKTAAAAGMVASIMLPSLARAREVAKRAESGANLRGIGEACQTYADDHDDAFPSSLRELVEAELITVEMLQSPLDPKDEAESYGYIAGQKRGDDESNVLAFEWLHSREGTMVLFLDGHVEWLPLDEAKRAVRETYRRLDREDEIPVDFRE